MNREIKFRALPEMYDKAFIYYPEIELTIRKNEFIYGYYLDGFIVDEVIDGNQDYLELNMWTPIIEETLGQFTGLLDKNGVEIYEGDKLFIKQEFQEVDGIVVYKENNASFMLLIDDEVYEVLWYDSKEYEIIGNIHQNEKGEIK